MIATFPVSSRDLRFEMTIGQPSDTAPMNLESGRSIEWVSVSFTDFPAGSISYAHRELPSALNSGFHSFSQLITRRLRGTLSRISPESMRAPSAYILHVEPTFHSLSTFIPNRYCWMISGVVSARYSFAAVVRM